jgi:hypothetical protein
MAATGDVCQTCRNWEGVRMEGTDHFETRCRWDRVGKGCEAVHWIIVTQTSIR